MTTDSSQAHLDMVYDGPALADGSMNVRDLAPQDLILDEVRQYAFSIVSLAFKEDNKWRLTDGHNTFPVLMRDEAFQRRVDNNDVAFAKGDVLVCDLRTIQWQVQDGVKSEYEVVRVVDHRHARQLYLFEEKAEYDAHA